MDDRDSFRISRNTAANGACRGDRFKKIISLHTPHHVRGWKAVERQTVLSPLRRQMSASRSTKIKTVTHWGSVALFALFAAVPWTAPHAETMGQWVIQDTEIQRTLETLATPIFRAAGLEPSAVRIHLVKDHSVNAFVKDGQNVFLSTGLVMRTKHADQLIGVIAHETGHIAGAHLPRTRKALRHAKGIYALSQTFAMVTMLPLGAPAVGFAGQIIGQAKALGSLIEYRRSQEMMADAAALTYLERSGQSARGLLTFFETLRQREELNSRPRGARGSTPVVAGILQCRFASGLYGSGVSTHPQTSDRIELVRHHVAVSNTSSAVVPAKLRTRFRRLQAKLHALFQPPQRIFARYPDTDVSVAARYARAIAHSRRVDLPRAMAELDSLIVERPDDPYFHELKGKILFENAQLAGAIRAYETAVRLMPEAPLLRLGLAAAQIETVEPVLNARAIDHLRAALRADKGNPAVWYRLSVASGRAGLFGLSALASAERALLRGRPAEARWQAERALKKLPDGSQDAHRAEGILLVTKRTKRE